MFQDVEQAGRGKPGGLKWQCIELGRGEAVTRKSALLGPLVYSVGIESLVDKSFHESASPTADVENRAGDGYRITPQHGE